MFKAILEVEMYDRDGENGNILFSNEFEFNPEKMKNLETEAEQMFFQKQDKFIWEYNLDKNILFFEMELKNGFAVVRIKFFEQHKELLNIKKINYFNV